MGASFYFVEIKIFTSVGARPHFHMIFHYYLYLPLKLFFFFLKRSKVPYIKIYSVQKGVKSVSVGDVVHPQSWLARAKGEPLPHAAYQLDRTSAAGSRYMLRV